MSGAPPRKPLTRLRRTLTAFAVAALAATLIQAPVAAPAHALAARATAVLGAQPTYEGIERAWPGDRDKDPAHAVREKAGRSCWTMSGDPYNRYLYVDVAAGAVPAGAKRAVVTVDYFDAGAVGMNLQYDSRSSAFTGATGLALKGTGTWRSHQFHSPYDESWLTFAHEGPSREIPDRIWARHPVRAPEGRCVFDQAAEGGTLAVGHERWMFHDLGALVCAYGESEAGPRGLYALHPDGRPARLVSAGERDWHCDISRDGRRAVVDTSGPLDAPGRGWQNAGQVSDVVLVDMATGARTLLARTAADRHPRHPHPVFTPDGTAVLHNHGDPSTGEVAVARVPLPREDSSR
ncbi:hypothetical protein [Streptomyces sp. NPDC002722]|uniref:hypothetical protein n=1 Tax=Streptomyces sp. NPDC002722 TaxID=3154425 RepID=UPI0033328B49